MINYNIVPDKELYGMCVAGDGKAWEYLNNYILKICQWWRLSHPEDMASQVTLELLDRRLGTIQKKDHFRYFVKLITQSRIKDYLKSPLNREDPITRTSEDGEEHEIDPRAGHHEPDQMERLSYMEVVDIVDGAIEKLSGICRAVMREYLKFKRGMYDDYEELSQVLGIPVPTVSSRVTRCMKIFVGFKEIQALRGLIT